ncbi:AEC family transporter [Pseudomonas leptonychotis]|uniref:AEC family transporter n=1 Tax=Pseudomonas leptonychotis TaxID=2448482 RepID=UPI00386EF2BB
MLAVVQQTISVTAPVFSMLFLGVALKRFGLIDTGFINTASTLVFRGTLPTLLFLGIIKADLSTALLPALLLYFVLATLGCFLLAWGWSVLRCPEADRGIYTQGAFRGNNGIVGLALATSMYGDYGLSVGAVLGGVVILSYNVLSAIILAMYSPQAKTDVWSLSKSIATNPLIVGVLLAIPFAAWQIPLPAWLLTSGGYFAQMSLPLALICIGATLTLDSLRQGSGVAVSSSLMKVFWLPLLATLGAGLCGFRGADLGILFLYFVSPTAAASFVMAKAVGGNAQLAAAIIVITTLASVVSTNLGLLVLQWVGWI